MKYGKWIFSGFLVLVSFAPARADADRALAQLANSRASHDTAELWAQRREELRRQFLIGAKLWPLPSRRPPVRAIIHGRREHDGYTVENAALETLPGFYCTGNLYRPLGRTGPGPAVLCPDGHFQPLGRFREDQQVRCAQLARMGATVFSYSMVGWQDSRQTNHDDPLVLALQTWNSIRAVDYLSSLDGVDPRRIGVTGASGGGTQTIYLTLVDDRVKVSAPVVIVYPWTEEDGCKCEGGLPIMRAARTNAIELTAAAAPRPQCIVTVGHDPTKVFPDVGLPFVERMYKLAGAQDALRNVHLPDEGHDYGPSKSRAVHAFLARHLGLDPVPDEPTRVAIEPPETLEVFNAAHPLPTVAVKGSEAVAKAFAGVFGAAALDAAAVLDGPLAEYAFKNANPDDEALIFTPPGFSKPGVPAEARGPEFAHLRIVVREGDSPDPLPCRVHVVGPDGNSYEPKDHPLKTYSLTGQWPKSGAWGNRVEKAPFRYFGHFFYCDGEAAVDVPAGAVRIEVSRGLEYRPETVVERIGPGAARTIEVRLKHAVPMPMLGFYSGDPHVHLPRGTANDDRTILDLMAADDIHYATTLAYNEPPGPYAGFMDKLASPQRRGLGKPSILSRGGYHVISGQEYRTTTFGHLNLFLLDELVMPGQSLNANNGPVYGDLVKEARAKGVVAFMAHGGYAQEVYADVVQGDIDAIELLQFGVYRGIGLADWYRFLNCGFRIPIVGACDYPACRKLGDALTYVAHPGGPPDIADWLRGAAAGRGFVTSGPLILFDVDGQGPGATIEKPGPGPHTVKVQLRVRSEVAPVTTLQLIVNGRIVQELKAPVGPGPREDWLTLEQPIALDRSSWVAARAFSLSPRGTPDAESHTNPVFVTIGDKAPYERAALDVLVQRIDGQIAAHKKRSFPEQAKVLAYFERARDVLLMIRERGGAPAKGHPSEIARDESQLRNLGTRTHTEEELRAFLKPIPRRPIEETLRAFETGHGFRMELVAREPLVFDPVAGAFDEDGNLYVAEMRDYPYKPKAGARPLGTVRKLIDRDGDGTIDEAHVFADQLLWAAGIAPWKGGVFVAAPPDIWYLKDTNGDHKADVREKVFTGFGTANQQAMLNNLQWWLDHKIYGATAANGGSIRPGATPDAPPVSLDGHDFRFDPTTRRIEPTTGTIQFGNTFNDWGDRFVCSESNPLEQIVLPEHYLARNPHLAVPRAIRNIAPSPVPIFRISPIEHWRLIRSGRRIAANALAATVAGASHHVVDAAAGVTIYRGGAYPPEFYGNSFVGDAQNNLVHRRVLVPDGVTFQSRRADEGTEFARSSDLWFRPVNFLNAPDGTLYALDMNREILESIHIPNDVMKFLDLTSGRDTGRIYRLAPPGFRYPGPPRLGRASTAELVAALESPHGWWRDTAHRLLFERQDKKAVEALRGLLKASRDSRARLHALWSLQGLDALSETDLKQALADKAPPVRAQALVLSEPWLDRSEAILDAVLALVPDAEPRVRFQLAFSLGAGRDPRAVEALATLARHAPEDHWLGTAVLSSASECADRLLTGLARDRAFRTKPGGVEILNRLATVVGARKRPAEVAAALGSLADVAAPGLRSQLVLALARGVNRSGTPLDGLVAGEPTARDIVASSIQEARKRAADASATADERTRAITLLGYLSADAGRPTLTALLDVTQPEPIQIAAIRALSDSTGSDIAGLLLDRWRSFGPAARREAIEALLAREDRTRAMLQAAEADPTLTATLDLAQRAALLRHRDETLRDQAQRLLGSATSGTRQQVIADYQAALQLPRDAGRGEAVFRRECAACHKIGATGHAIGPDLTSSATRAPEALLTHILDPNQYVLPNYVQYQVVDRAGRVLSGLIAAQTATSLTLKREEDRTETLLRVEIEELAGTGRSLMPEGLEAKVTKPEMADLIGFLQAAQANTPAAEPPLDIGSLPGLVEPERPAPPAPPR